MTGQRCTRTFTDGRCVQPYPRCRAPGDTGSQNNWFDTQVFLVMTGRSSSRHGDYEPGFHPSPVLVNPSRRPIPAVRGGPRAGK